MCIYAPVYFDADLLDIRSALSPAKANFGIFGIFENCFQIKCEKQSVYDKS